MNKRSGEAEGGKGQAQGGGTRGGGTRIVQPETLHRLHGAFGRASNGFRGEGTHGQELYLLHAREGNHCEITRQPELLHAGRGIKRRNGHVSGQN